MEGTLGFGLNLDLNVSKQDPKVLLRVLTLQ